MQEIRRRSIAWVFCLVRTGVWDHNGREDNGAQSCPVACTEEGGWDGSMRGVRVEREVGGCI